MTVLEKMPSDSKDAVTEEYVEYAKRKGSTVTEVDDLSAIEATAASTAAWLISITISLGGLVNSGRTTFISRLYANTLAVSFYLPAVSTPLARLGENE